MGYLSTRKSLLFMNGNLVCQKSTSDIRQFGLEPGLSIPLNKILVPSWVSLTMARAALLG
jgi:hypothetical protein